MTLEVRQLVIRSEIDNGKGASRPRDTAGGDDGQEPCCAEDKAISGDHAERRSRARELRDMLERLGER